MPTYAVTLHGERLDVVPGDEGTVSVAGRLCRVIPIGPQEFAVQVGQRTIRVAAAGADGTVQLVINGKAAEAGVMSNREAVLKEYSARSGHVAGPAELRAPMPALVVRVEVATGDAVRAGQGLIVLEAMKMENELRATHDAVVREVHVAKGATVEKNQLLLSLEEGRES
jgi:biotin carboxyl carrier protein